MKNGNKVMKITKGVIRTEEGIQDIPAYVTKCSSSLMHCQHNENNCQSREAFRN